MVSFEGFVNGVRTFFSTNPNEQKNQQTSLMTTSTPQHSQNSNSMTSAPPSYSGGAPNPQPASEVFAPNTDVPYRFDPSQPGTVLIPQQYSGGLSTGIVDQIKKQGLNVKFEENVSPDQLKTGGGLYSQSFPTYTGSTILQRGGSTYSLEPKTGAVTITTPIQPQAPQTMSQSLPLVLARDNLQYAYTQSAMTNTNSISPMLINKDRVYNLFKNEPIEQKAVDYVSPLLRGSTSIPYALSVGSKLLGIKNSKSPTDYVVEQKIQDYEYIKSNPTPREFLTRSGVEFATSIPGLVSQAGVAEAGVTALTTSNIGLRIANPIISTLGGVGTVAYGASVLRGGAGAQQISEGNYLGAGLQLIPEGVQGIRTLKSVQLFSPTPSLSNTNFLSATQRLADSGIVETSGSRITQFANSENRLVITGKNTFGATREPGTLTIIDRYGNPTTLQYELRSYSKKEPVTLTNPQLQKYIDETVPQSEGKGSKGISVVKLQKTTTSTERILQNGLIKDTIVSEPYDQPYYQLLRTKSRQIGKVEVTPTIPAPEGQERIVKSQSLNEAELIRDNAGISQQELKRIYENLPKGKRPDMIMLDNAIAEGYKLNIKRTQSLSDLTLKEFSFSQPAKVGQTNTRLLSTFSGEMKSISGTTRAEGLSSDVVTGFSVKKEPKVKFYKGEPRNSPFNFNPDESNLNTIVEKPNSPQEPVTPQTNTRSAVELSAREYINVERFSRPTSDISYNSPLPKETSFGLRGLGVASQEQTLTTRQSNSVFTPSLTFDQNLIFNTGSIQREVQDSKLNQRLDQGLKSLQSQSLGSLSSQVSISSQTTQQATQQLQATTQFQKQFQQTSNKGFPEISPREPRGKNPFIPEAFLPKPSDSRPNKTKTRLSIRLSTEPLKIKRKLDVKADLISVNASQAVYGKSTSPKPTKLLLKTAGTRLRTPTIEIQKYSNAFKKSFLGK